MDSNFDFWKDVFSASGADPPRLWGRVFVFGGFAAAICILDASIHPNLAIEVSLYELIGAALGLMLVLRINEGYGRWWEGRILWGSLVNGSRNLAIQALAYGPADPAWRAEVVHWTIAFNHACRRYLRGEREFPELIPLIGEAEADRLSKVPHAPNVVSLHLAEMFRAALDAGTLDRAAFLRLDQERALLIDKIGGCERIKKTPLPWALVVQLRRFITVYLLTLPLALIAKIGWWPTPIVTVLVAYPILCLDRIAAELQNPFSKTSLNHLPLDDITQSIEMNLLALIEPVKA